MTKYSYKVKNIDGKILSSKIEAQTFSEAAGYLEQQGYTILEITEDASSTIKQYSFSSNYQSNCNPNEVFSIREKLDFFNSFYHMYGAGLSMHEVFTSVLEANKNKKIRAMCVRILKKIEKGKTLEEAFLPCSSLIGFAYTNLIIAGEKSGKLEEILLKIIKNIKREDEINHKVITAITYPTANLAFAFLVFLFFKFFILKMFASFGSPMCSTSIMILLVTAIIKIVIIFGIIVGILFAIYKNKKLLSSIVNNLLKLPMLAGIVKEISFLNFFSVLGLSFNAGIPIAKAVELGNSVINIKDINKRLKSAIERIANGCELTSAFAIANVFSEYAMSQISSGEKSGTIDESCQVIVHNYEKKVETKIDVAIKTIQPIAILIVGLFVLYILYTGYSSYYGALLNAL